MAKKKKKTAMKVKAIKTTGRGRRIEGGLPEAGRPGRGSSVQGERQDAKGGPQGANQGGASRGGSRVEPSHARERMMADRAGKKKKGR
jgi:hypothetical protein